MHPKFNGMISAIRLFFIVCWTFLLMLLAPLFIPLTFNRQFPLVVARTLFSSVLMKIVGINLTTVGTENVPKDRPVIFVANHCSHLDIACLCRSVPVNLHFIGKKELVWMPVVGWYMFIAGHIFIDRSNRKKAVLSLRKAAEKIKNGKCVVMYPEGTRTSTGKIGEFKKGAFHLALDAGVDIVPVHIKGTFSVWPKNTSKITPGKVVVRIGKPIQTIKYTKKTVRNFVADTQFAVEELGQI
ncbi:MAG: lysophospholipid acyltransferase family protein [Vicingaceae bacterium]